jgi:hypothetical protein
MGAVVLLCGGCHQLRQKCCLVGCHRELPGYDPHRVIVNAGYSETCWIPLAPPFESTGCVEHFADDLREIPVPVAGEDVPTAPREMVSQASAEVPAQPSLQPPIERSTQASEPARVPVHPRAPELVQPESNRVHQLVRPVSANAVEDAQLLLDFIRS